MLTSGWEKSHWELRHGQAALAGVEGAYWVRLGI